MIDLSTHYAPAPISDRPRKPPREKQPRKRPRMKSKHRPADLLRIYGVKERREWFLAQRCAWCELEGRTKMCGRTEQAHTVNGGRGRKADAETIVPLGTVHHRAYDRRLPPFDDPRVRLVVKGMATEYTNLWLTVSGVTA